MGDSESMTTVPMWPEGASADYVAARIGHVDHLPPDVPPRRGPGLLASVLVREGGHVRHLYSLPANFLDGSERGIDLLSPVWNVLDLLPDGRGDWYAGNSCPGRARR